jgi:uncharacterized membrane protein
MIWLVLGVLVWSAVHLFPCVAAPVRARVVERLGSPYQGLFALAIVLSIVLMVIGWRSAVPSVLYTPPAWGRLATNVLMFVALVLFAASGVPSGVPTNLKRVLRHPQLTGFGIWAASHLLSNGDSRSVVLFGGLGLWAVVAIVAINQRDGAWEKPAPQPMSAELKPVIAAVVAFALVFLAHPWISGVSPTP